MKFLPLIILSLFITGCASDQRPEQDGIQKEEQQEKQNQEEENARTGASDDIAPGYQGQTATQPHSVN